MLHQFSHSKSGWRVEDFNLSLLVTGANRFRRLKGKYVKENVRIAIVLKPLNRNRPLDKIDEVKKKIDLGMDKDRLLARLQQTQVSRLFQFHIHSI